MCWMCNRISRKWNFISFYLNKPPFQSHRSGGWRQQMTLEEVFIPRTISRKVPFSYINVGRQAPLSWEQDIIEHFPLFNKGCCPYFLIRIAGHWKQLTNLYRCKEPGRKRIRTTPLGLRLNRIGHSLMGWRGHTWAPPTPRGQLTREQGKVSNVDLFSSMERSWGWRTLLAQLPQ